MRLNTLFEDYRFPDGQMYRSDYQGSEVVPVILPDQIEKLQYLYHNSNNPNLAQTGILPRAQLGLIDKWKAGIDTTYQNAVYLSLNPDLYYGQYTYKVNLSFLDRTLFRVDEDAPQHTDAQIQDNDWIASLMIMGALRYEGAVPPEAVARIN